MRSESGSGDKYPSLGLLTSKCTIERLQLRTADSALPAFGLDIHFYQTELIEGNYSVNPAISATPYTPQICSASSVAETVQYVEHNNFKTVWTDLK